MALGGMCKQLDRRKDEDSVTTSAHSRGSIVAAEARVLVVHQVVVCGVVASEWLGLANLTINYLFK